MPVTPTGEAHARIVLLAGPSGAGKSRLAGRLHTAYGWPIVNLDDFYKDADAPGLPQHAALGIVDWDDPRSWDAEGAVGALACLIRDGECELPVYDLGASRRVSVVTLRAQSQHLIIAEGIFAAEIVAPLRSAGLLHSAWCVRNRPVVTFVRRLARDLAERRKPPPVLLKRGWQLMRAEPDVVARAAARGATPARATEVEAALGRR